MASTQVIWSDLDHRIVTDGQGAIKVVTNIQSVFTSIDNIVNTHPGERVMLPEFASGIGDMLFELINKGMLQKAANSVKQTIERWDDRPIITGVDFKSDSDSNFVNMTIYFQVKGYLDTYTYTKRIKVGGG